MKSIATLLLLFVGSQLFAQNMALDPNNSFFSPKGNLLLLGETAVSDDFNGNKHYDRIGGWSELGDTIVWGIKDMQPGMVNIELFAGIAAAENNSTVTVFLDNQQQDLNVTATATLQDFQSQGTASFMVSQAGTHEIKLKIKTQNTTSNFGEIERLVVSGTAVSSATPWIRRWRPAATHASFLSDNNVNTEISVFELNILSHQLASYQVMTTEFGYVGSPNQVASQGLTGLNFSLWSYDANAPVPPHYQLSHLIAVGGSGNGFGRYGHEGTGVKPRGFDPYGSSTTYQFTVAVRKEPGPQYHTYWCYFLDPATSHWKLYGCGKVYNDDGDLNYLNTTGGFLEIVGPPKNSRTGHRLHSVEFRGWRMQSDGSWNVLNGMIPAYNSATALSYKEWTQNSSGDKFILKGGGFRESGPNPGTISLNNPPALPTFLQGTYVDELFEMPAVFETLPPDNVTHDEATLKFNISKLGTNPEIKLFYGTDYGLTEGIHADYLIDTVWQSEMNVPLTAINNNVLTVQVPGLSPNTAYFYRLRIQNDEGITWSHDADTIQTDNAVSSLESQVNGEMLTAFPNPTTGHLTLAHNGLRKGALKLYNSFGQLVLSQDGVDKNLNIQHLESGLYYLQVESKGQTKVIKVVKE